MGLSPKTFIDLPIRVAREVLHTFTGTASCCRYSPTCSRYAREAIARFGWWRGGWMSLLRIIRCSPLGSYGFDPVPRLDS